MKRRGKRSARYHRYRRAVSRATKQADIGPPPYGMKDPTVDHVIPISEGFKRDIPASKIGSAENLQWLERQDNLAKGRRITEQALELIEQWES